MNVPQVKSAVPGRRRNFVSRSAERRQLTVMFCDLVGSTSLFAELDPEDISQVLRTYFRCCADRIEAAGGFVAQYQGDGVLGYFGYTQASESSAEQAVRAALEIIEPVSKIPLPRGRQLRARIGISTGLAVVGDRTGEGTRLEQGAVGETLHLAARLQALAGPNEIIIAESTRRLTGRLFGYGDLGKQTLKGFIEPVQLWRVLGSRPTLSQFKARRNPLLTQIVGRDAEISTLLELWRQASAGQGQIASIVGEAGIGKSRLINEFRHRIARGRHLWLEGGGAQSFNNTPFYSIAQMIKRALDPAGRSSAIEFRSRLHRVLEGAGMRAGEILPLIVEMLKLPGSESISPLTMAPGERRDRLFSVVSDWLRRATRRRPVVIAVEDLHWLDPSSLELVGYLVERIKTLPVLMLHSMRPGFRPAWAVSGCSADLNLRRLSDNDLRRIVVKVRRTAALLTNEDVAHVVERAEGVPLFGIELARFVGERHARAADQEIPTTLADLLTARLDQLGPAKPVAQLAAVIGDEIPLKVLEAVSEIPAPRFRLLLRTLIKTGVLQEVKRYPDVHYAFAHSLLREAAYDALLRSQRRELHRRAASVISDKFEEIASSRPELLAHHWTNAGELELGSAAWERAGGFAASRRAFSEAERAYQSAVSALMGLPPSQQRDATELTQRSLLADVLRITRGFSAQQTVEATARARALIAWILDDEAEAQRRIDHALAVACDNDNPYDLAYAECMTAIHLVLLNKLEGAADFARSSIALSDKHTFPQFAAISRVALGRAQAGLGFAAEGTRLMREGLARMAGTSVRVAITRYMTWLAEALLRAGSFNEALVAVEEALQINPQELFFRPETLRSRGEILRRIGELGEAERDFLEAISLANRMGARRFRDRATSSLQRLLQGDAAAAGGIAGAGSFVGNATLSPTSL